MSRHERWIDIYLGCWLGFLILCTLVDPYAFLVWLGWVIWIISAACNGLLRKGQ